MKSYLSRTLPLGILMSLLITEKGRCQVADAKSDSAWSFVIVNTRTHEAIVLAAGRKLRYRLQGSRRYVYATIAEIGETTVSFQGKDKKRVSVKLEEFAALKIPRSTLRKVAGVVLSVIGGLITLIAADLIYEGSTAHDDAYTAGWYLGGLVGLPAIAAGIHLTLPHKINPGKGTWKLTLRRDLNDTSMIK